MTLRFERGNKADAFAIRSKVFVEEQGFCDEFDDIDESALHVTLYEGDRLVGCARTFPDSDDPTHFIFGRLAVLPEARKKGFGALILEEAEEYARIEGASEMHLHAQCHAVPFYERFGYRSYGEVELDEHVEHIWMSKAL